MYYIRPASFQLLEQLVVAKQRIVPFRQELVLVHGNSQMRIFKVSVRLEIRRCFRDLQRVVLLVP